MTVRSHHRAAAAETKSAGVVASIGMNVRVAAAVAALSVTACASQDIAERDGGWVGTITTEGNVTTVINESGSVWGGEATLVEEASIGVAVGPDEYMLGEVSSLYATDDEIYVLDGSVSEVRVYDFDGNHLRSFGRPGQGPGEIGHQASSLLVASDGRVYVGDRSNRRITIFDEEGETAGDFPLPSATGSGIVPMVFADDGGVWWTVRVSDEDGSSTRNGVQVITANGPIGDPLLVPEIDYERLFVRVDGRDIGSVPFAPRFVWTFSHDRALIAGAGDRYAFRMIRPTGETTLVERFWEPVPVTAEEADYWRRFTISQFGGAREISWNGENIPDHKPAFIQFLPAASGEVWVLRNGDGGMGPCDLEPEELATVAFSQDFIDCLYPNHFFDVFDRDGRYLGWVEGLQLLNTPPFVSGDTVIAPIEDDAGTIMVKRYRLVLPGEQE